MYKKGAHIIWEVDGAEQKVGHLFSFLKQPRNRFLGRHTARTSVYLENYSSIYSREVDDGQGVGFIVKGSRILGWGKRKPFNSVLIPL